MRGTTPFPNVVLDTYLPRLRDSEWRLLCVVIRQTLGFVTKDGKRKGQDWITNSQFRAKTGRGRDAVSTAIDSLVRQGLLDVHDKRGHGMRSTSIRKSRFGKLYFSLGPVLLDAIAVSNRSGRIDNTDTTKANSTKETHNKIGIKSEGSGLVPTPKRSGWTQAGAVAGMPLHDPVAQPPKG
jgi:hypothetical protein